MAKNISTDIVSSSYRLRVAKEFLKKLLADGPRPSREIHAEAKMAGILEGTLDRARKSLRVRLEPIPMFHGGVRWVLSATRRYHSPPASPVAVQVPSSTQMQPEPVQVPVVQAVEPAYLLLTSVGREWPGGKDLALTAYSKAKAAGRNPRLFREVKVVEQTVVTVKIAE